MRVFIAIELPDGIKKQLAGLQAELKKAGADAKWVNPELIHITLKFLGEIDDPALKRVFAAVNRAAGSFAAFPACLESAGAFPSLDSPRVIWAGIGTGAPQLREIYARLELELAAEGLDVEEEREFAPHATLARTRSSLNRKDLAKRLHDAAAKPIAAPDFQVNAITVFKSILSPTGPTYEPLVRSPLSGK